jgi:hypothetical protein
MTTDIAKLKACPCPRDLTDAEASMWRDFVCRLPLGCIPRAHQDSLALYVKLSAKQRRLAQTRVPDVSAISKIARVLRSTALRLGLNDLLKQESRSDEGALAAVASDVLQGWEKEDHPRFGLIGARVRNVEEALA